MAFAVDSLSLQPAASLYAPVQARAEPVAPVGQRDGASNDRRNQSKERERAVLNFRAALNAATVSSLTKALGEESKPVETATDAPARAPARASKVPDAEPVVLSGAEAANLYRTAQAEKESQPSRAPEFLAAATRYAKSYFAVSGTYARPGESLELMA